MEKKSNISLPELLEDPALSEEFFSDYVDTILMLISEGRSVEDAKALAYKNIAEVYRKAKEDAIFDYFQDMKSPLGE